MVSVLPAATIAPEPAVNEPPLGNDEAACITGWSVSRVARTAILKGILVI